MTRASKAGPVAKILFTLIALACALFIVVHSGKPLAIDTNLKDLSPTLTRDQSLQAAVAHLSTAIENRFLLLTTGPDLADTVEAANLFATMLSGLDGVHTSVGEQAASDNLLVTLAQYRFNLLTAEQQQQLETASTDNLVASATRRLYQLAGGSRLLPVDEDPFGWFTDYVLERVGQLAPLDNDQPYQAFTRIHVSLEKGGLETSVQQRLQRLLGQAEQQVAAQYPEIRVLHSGVFFFASEAARAAKRDIKLISTASVIAIVALLLLTFYSLRPLLLPFASVATGIGFAFVVTYVIYDSIHILTIVFGASLIGIVIDYSLHYFYCHSDQAASSTRKGLMNAMKLSLLSSIIGYGALGFSDLVSLQRIAVFSCAGLIAAWIAVLALARPLMGNQIRINPRFLPPLVQTLTRTAAFLATAPRLLTATIWVLLIVLALSGVRGNDNPRVFFNPPAVLLEQEKEVATLSTTVEPGRYFIARADSEQQLFAQLQQLFQRLPDASLLSIASWLPSPDQQRENYLLQQSLYAKGAAIEQFMANLTLSSEPLQTTFAKQQGQILSALSLFADPTAPLPPLATDNNGQLAAFVLIRDAATVRSPQQVAASVPGIDYIDIAAMSTSALHGQRVTALWFLLLAFVLIAAIMLLRYRNRHCLLMMLVPLTSVATVLLLLSMWGSGITLFHSMALFLVLGLGMDYVIFVSELQNEHHITLQAVFLSAITSLLSFGLLSLSAIPVVHAFGITVLIGNGLNLIGSMVYASLLQRPVVAG